MNSQTVGFRVFCALFTMAALFSQPALATLKMSTVPSNVYQLSTTSLVSLGHSVIAGTNLSRLIAGGSFLAECGSPYTGVIPGERELTSALIGKYNQLVVTIPDWVPALRDMPGFDNVPRGSRLSCTYNWKSYASEPEYLVGIPGFQIKVGGETAKDSGAVFFQMQKPGTATGEDDACIP
ncbi:MAG TPA: hypothetical protein VFO82_03840 [Steroidobacteraceae bacterium]|nr:hypothetical protein [Steroidobacteraceae bacterium]